MKTLETLFHSVSESLRLAKQLFGYLRIFLSAFFRQRASLGCELVAMRSQLSFYKESIRQKKQPRPRFTPAFRLLWVIQQLREAMPFGVQPTYLFRDNDGI